MRIKNILSILTFVGLFLIAPQAAAAATYYVSPTGNDTNNGSTDSPFATFTHAVDQLNAGDSLILKNGTYQQQLVIPADKDGAANALITIQAENIGQAIIDYYPSQEASAVIINGDYIKIVGLEVLRSKNYGIENKGQYNIIQSNKVHDSIGHGIYTDNVYTTIDANEVFHASMMNQPRTIDSGWGSAIKVKMGGDHAIIRNNYVYNNYGEGIAVTRGADALVRNNFVYNNYAVNIYVDNSYNVLVENNFAYCTPNSGYERDGHAAAAFGMEEEDYPNWGAQLHDVTWQNNIATGCYRGFYYWRSDVAGTGLQNVKIIHNTLVNMTHNTMAIETTPSHSNNLIANNIFYQDDNSFGYLDSTAGFSVHHNLFNTQPSDTNLRGSNDVYANPELVGNQTHPNYYKISSSSPAINQGASLGVTQDFWGTIRDSQPDMGANEFSSTVETSPSPTATASPTASPAASPTSTPGCTLNAGDATGDGKVNLFDYTVFLSEFMKTKTTYKADFNCDTRVNTLDYTIFLNNYHLN
jgi:hypothetical protein